MSIPLTKRFGNRAPLSKKALSELLSEDIDEFRYESIISESSWGHCYTIVYRNGYGVNISKGPKTRGGDDNTWQMTIFRREGPREDATIANSCSVGFLTEAEAIKYCHQISQMKPTSKYPF